HPGVLSPFGVMGGGGIQRKWKIRLSLLHFFMEGVDRHTEKSGGVTHLVMRDQSVVQIEDRIFDSLRGKGTGKLLGTLENLQHLFRISSCLPQKNRLQEPEFFPPLRTTPKRLVIGGLNDFFFSST